MTDIGPVQPRQTIPNQAVLQPGQRGTVASYALRAAPPVFTVATRMGNMQMATVAIAVERQQPTLIRTSRGFTGPRIATGSIAVAGLVHVRSVTRNYSDGNYGDNTYGDPTAALAPIVSTSNTKPSLVHDRALGTIVVSTPIVIPPPPPPPPPPGGTGATLTSGPRSILGVKRRVSRSRR